MAGRGKVFKSARHGCVFVSTGEKKSFFITNFVKRDDAPRRRLIENRCFRKSFKNDESMDRMNQSINASVSDENVANELVLKRLIAKM